jgi:DNA-binding NtrC family response regulator
VKKILVAEDQANWHRSLKAMLPPPDYELHIVSDCLEAEKLLKKEEIDSVIVNINLLDNPEMPNDRMGDVLLELILNKHPSMPRIVMSGNPGGPIFSTYAPFKVDEVLIKGQFTGPDLRNAIDRAIARRKVDRSPGNPPDSQVIAEVQELVAQDRIEEALEKLTLIALCRNEATLISRRFHSVRMKDRQRTITYEEAQAQYTQIAEAILSAVSYGGMQ